MYRPSVLRYRICEGGLLFDVPADAVEERVADIEERLVSLWLVVIIPFERAVCAVLRVCHAEV